MNLLPRLSDLQTYVTFFFDTEFHYLKTDFMRYIFLVQAIFTFLFSTFQPLNAQILAKWTFEEVATPSTTPTNGQATNGVWAAGINSTFYAGVSSTRAIGGTGFGSTFNANSGYLEFSVSPNPAYAMSLTSLSFDEQRSNAGPATWALRSSLDGFTTDLNTGATVTAFGNKSTTLTGFSNQTSGVTFRIYGYGATSTAGTWRIDNLTINGSIAVNTSPYITTTKSAVSLLNTPEGLSSISDNFSISGGFLSQNINLSAPTGFEISLAANSGFMTNLNLTQTGGTVNPMTIYVRQTGTTAGNYSANLVATSGTVTQNILLTGTTHSTGGDGTFAQANTLDVVAWNIEWFGHPTEGPTNNERQKDNVTTVLQTLKADMYLFSEVSDASLFAQIVNNLTGYSSICSNETSYSITDPDPMSQKLCFAYKTDMFSNIETKALLTTFKYDTNLVVNYPSDRSRFWASGRLPYLLTADVTLNGTTKRMGFVGIHARANSSSDDPIGRYNMRKYDIERLKDSLDGQYPNLPFVLLGDFNDDLDFTVVSGISGSITSYINYKNDNARYSLPTLALSLAGQRSTVSFNSVIDHIAVSNEVTPAYVSNSARLGVPSNYITSYGSSTTDHYPVMARFNLANVISAAVPVEWLNFSGKEADKNTILLNWATATERDAAYFLVERSDDGKDFTFIGEVKATGGTTQTPQYYSFYDKQPTASKHYYRLRQVDKNGQFIHSNTMAVQRWVSKTKWVVYPNPASQIITWEAVGTEGGTSARLYDTNGRLVRTSFHNQMPVFDVSNGIYFLEIAKQNGDYFREKVFVNH